MAIDTVGDFCCTICYKKCHSVVGTFYVNFGESNESDISSYGAF